MTTNIDIHDLPTGAVLAALFNNAIPKGMGFLAASLTPMAQEQGDQLLGEVSSRANGGAYFDYVQGRCLKVEFSARRDDGYDRVDVRLYDRDHGEGAGQRVIEYLRTTSAHLSARG